MKMFYLFAVLVLTGIAACKSDYDAPCRDQAVQQTFRFTDQQTAQFPYRDNDTIGFVSSSFDTLLFYADTVVSFQTYQTTTKEGNPECPPDVDAYNGMQARYRELGSGLSFRATFWKYNDTCELSVEGVRSVLPIALIGDSSFHYADSVVLLNKTFYKVNAFATSAGDSMLVNAADGLLFFTYAGKPYYQFKYNSK